MKRFSMENDPLKIPEIVHRYDSPFAPAEPDTFFDSGYELKVQRGKDEGLVFPLDCREMVLGRKDFDFQVRPGYILFEDPRMEEIHAELKWEEDIGKYIIYRKSPEFPIFVNNEEMESSLLKAGYLVKMGKTVFEVVSLEEKQKKESALIWEKFRMGDERGETAIESGYQAVVVEGPDEGRAFDLDKNLMIIGRSRGVTDIRDTSGILLNDEELPEELALLIWDEREEKYKIFQSEKNSVDLFIYRILESESGIRRIGQKFRNTLEERDSITAGNTVIIIRRICGEDSGRLDMDSFLALDEKEDKVDEAITTPGIFAIEYVFHVIDGPGRGDKVSILSTELTEGKRFNFGSAGPRKNEIEFDDRNISNEQGYFEYRDKGLYMVSNGDVGEIAVENRQVVRGESVLLNGGCRIRIGKSILEFTDNRLLSALRKFSLEVILGEVDDVGKRFPLKKTKNLIGRGSACDVRVMDPEVSRQHALLSFRDGRFYLEHKSRVNPTFVNGVSVKLGQERIIFPGDKIYISSRTALQLGVTDPF